MPTTSEVAAKLAKLRSLSDAISRAEASLSASPSHPNAIALQRLQRQRSELRATLPPLRLVQSNVPYRLNNPELS